MQVEASETKNLVAGFTKPETIIEGGFHVAKVKYITLRADDRSIYGKQVRAVITPAYPLGALIQVIKLCNKH